MQIHELNNFTGTLGSGAYLAIDDGTDTGKISSQGLLAAIEARIDNIITSPAPTEQEIIDARLGADGVTYNSLGTAIRTQFTDVKSDSIQNYIQNYTNNRYVRYDTGAADVGNGWKLVEFPVYEEETFEYNATNANPDTRGVAFYNSGGTFISGVQMLTTAQTITVPQGAVLAKASLNSTLDQLQLKTNSFEIYNSINDVRIIANTAKALSEDLSEAVYEKILITDFSSVPTSYIRDTGVIGYSSLRTVQYFMCEKNATYIINSSVVDSEFRVSYSTTKPAQNVSTDGVVGNASGTSITITTDDDATYLLFSKLNTDNNVTVYHLQSKSDDIRGQLNPLYAFENITCIGDSLTYGVVSTDSNGGYRKAKYPYPAVLQRIIGATVEDIAHGGYSSSDWWGAYSDSIVSKNNQLAIVFLGTNGGLTDTVSTDCAGDDYTQFASTNTGNYGKIVGKLKSVGAKVILVQCFTGDGTLADTNKAIKDIADKFGCGLIATKRLLNPAYHYYPDLSGLDTLHFNDLGYSAFANFLIKQISEMDSDYLKFIIPS